MVDLKMPRLGETVTEGVIVKWLKKEGDEINEEEPLVEVSTDKIETDIPSPYKGILKNILAEEGEKIIVGDVIAKVELEEEKNAKEPAKDEKREEFVQRPRAKIVSEAPSVKKRMPKTYSPFVRKLAKEKNIDLSEVKGTGAGGRVTKNDVIGHVKEKGSREREIKKQVTENEIMKLSVSRKKEAENLIKSQKSSAHVTALVEVDFTNIDKIRSKVKEEFKQKEGFSLTYLPFVASATITALRKMPLFNAQIIDDAVIYKSNINMGIAVALEDELIVPVIKKAENLSLIGLARAINNIATKARAKKLSVDDVYGGTFSITNNGSFGSLIQTPIIVPGQVAILSLEAITKRVTVIDDAITIRKMAFLPLTYDHRIIDGSKASIFLGEIKNQIEKAKFFH